MKSIRSYLSFLILIIGSLTSCMKNDVFDSNYSNDKFVVPSIDKNFDWSMFSIVKLNVSAGDNYGGKYYYRIDIYDSNPEVDENSTLFAVGVCKKDMDFTAEIIIPASLNSIYVVQTSPNGNKCMKMLQIEASSNEISLKCDFNINDYIDIRQSRKTYSSMTKSSDDILSDYQNYSKPSDIISITSNSNFDLQSNKSYLIPAGFEYSSKFNFDGKSNVKIYVEGVWRIKSETRIQDSDIIVLGGGLVSVENNAKIEFIHTSAIAIQNEGKFTDNNYSSTLNFRNRESNIYNNGDFIINGKITIDDGGKIYNKGKLDVEQINTQSSATKISNNGVFECDNISTIGAEIRNNGDFIVEKLKMEQGSFNNIKSLDAEEIEWNRTSVMVGCLVTSEDIKTRQATISLANNACIKCEDWNMSGTVINFDSNSSIDVTDELEIHSENSTFKALGDNYSLLKAEEIKFSGYQVGRFSGKLGIAVDKYNSGGQWNPTFTATNDILWSKYSDSPIIIPSNDCNSGSNPGPGVDPEDPQFPITEEALNLFTFVVEDVYPYFGDYDMNDIVVNLSKQVKYINAENEIIATDLEFTLKAVGAAKQLSAGLQFDKIDKSNIKSVEITGRELTTSNFDITNNLENSQYKPVVILFDDAHKLLSSTDNRVPINTSSSTCELKTVKVKVEFKNPVKQIEISATALNLFAVTFDKDQRYEIHAPGFVETSLYTSNYPKLGGYMWALVVPSDFKYPTETTNINDAYPEFKNWVESNKTQNKNWYENPIADKVFK